MDADINQVQDIPLERLLLEKNKKLENQFTAIKMENQDMMTNINENILQLTKFKSEIDTKTLLIQRLESDIHRLNEIQERHQKSPSFENLIQELDQTTPPSGRRNDSTIVPILTSQRDRYKQRFEESHRKSITMQSQFQDLTDENSRLQKDNLILYEKLKYQDSYSSQTNIQLENINQRNTVTDKYKNMYDIEIDPFQKFKAKERKRGENLGVPERIAMGFTKLLTMNKYSRLVFVVYSGLLHLLVFFCMFELATLDRVRNRQTSFSIPNKPLTK
jgi:homeobox protein cut-like